MSEIATIGLDIAKNVSQLHRVDRSGKIVLRRALLPQPDTGFLQHGSPLPDRVRDLRDRSPLGARSWPSAIMSA